MHHSVRSPRELLQQQIQRYQTTYPEEQAFVERFVQLLKHARAFHRDHLPGHITASAWIVDALRSKVLLTHHAKLNRWLQPGGHADGDEDVLRVAMKEAREETGLISLAPVSTEIFDIDIHRIPERNGFPKHDHYDVRFLFTADAAETFTVTEESHDLAWVGLSEIKERSGNNASMIRMAGKFGLDSPQEDTEARRRK